MRKMAVVAVILALIISGSIWEHHVVNNACDSLNAKLKDLTEPYQASQIEEIEHLWAEQEKALKIFTRHEGTDEIKVDIAKLKSLSGEGDYSDAGMLLGEIQSHISVIREEKEINWTNIF